MSAPLRICCCRGIAVVISLTALGGTTVPALADPPPPPPVTRTYGPAPGPLLPAYVAPRPTRSTNEWPTRGTSESPTRGTSEWPTRGTPTPPVTNTPPPETRTWPPVTTTPPPETTTPPPETTTPPPETTTPPPETRTSPPVTNTPPPVTTTTAPVTPVADESTGGWTLALLLALTCAALLSAGLLTRAYRHRGLGWVQAHVTVKPQPGPGATFETRPGDEPNRDHVLTVVPVEVRCSTTVEEDLS